MRFGRGGANNSSFLFLLPPHRQRGGGKGCKRLDWVTTTSTWTNCEHRVFPKTIKNFDCSGFGHRIRVRPYKAQGFLSLKILLFMLISCTKKVLSAAFSVGRRGIECCTPPGGEIWEMPTAHEIVSECFFIFYFPLRESRRWRKGVVNRIGSHLVRENRGRKRIKAFLLSGGNKYILGDQVSIGCGQKIISHPSNPFFRDLCIWQQ